DTLACSAKDRYDVTEVELALRVVRLHVAERFEQRAGLVRVCADIDFFDRTLLRRRVSRRLRLDDPFDLAGARTQDAPVLAGIVELPRRDRRGGARFAVVRGECFEKARLDERMVSREHDHVL